MIDPAKIHLSELETELVNNTEWIFSKQKITEKLYYLFGELHTSYREIVAENHGELPLIFQKPGGKISRGENYNGLPYLMLDYPAMFSKENIFAVRTMFWWGNFFSVTLHLSGKYFENKKDLSKWLAFFREKKFSICVSEGEWEHDFHPYNFTEIKFLDEIQIGALAKKDFFKVSRRIELSEWGNIALLLEQSFRELIDFILINFPADEKVL
jgi:hypothetical protein